MNHSYLLGGIALLLFPILVAPAVAEVKLGDFEVSANAALLSDYVGRGISQTDRKPALQGGLDLVHTSGLYLGIWGSNISEFTPGDGAHLEMNYTVGWTHTLENGIGLDLGIIRYDYPGALRSLEYNYEEVFLGASYTLLGVDLNAKYYYSPDYSGSLTNQNASYIDLKMAHTMEPGITVTGHFGRSFGESYENDLGLPAHYDDYSLTFGGEVVGFGIELGWFATDENRRDLFANKGDDTVVLKVSRKF